MTFFADENFPRQAIEALRAEGFDVQELPSGSHGASDREVLSRAFSEGRILLTLDKDFGELAFKSMQTNAGIILFRLAPGPSASFINRFVEVLRGNYNWKGAFSVVEIDRIRSRRLPESGES